MSIFVECYTLNNKNILLEKGFTFLEAISNEEKFVFFNDGQFDFSTAEMDVSFHDQVNL